MLLKKPSQHNWVLGAEERVERMVKFKTADETLLLWHHKRQDLKTMEKLFLWMSIKLLILFDDSDPGLAPNPPAT